MLNEASEIKATEVLGEAWQEDDLHGGEHHTYTDRRRHPFMVLHGVEQWRLNRAKTVRKIARALPEIEAPIADIIPTQNFVHKPVVDAMQTASPEGLDRAREPVIFVRKDGHLFLADGHHRLVTAILNDRPTLRGRLLDFDVT